MHVQTRPADASDESFLETGLLQTQRIGQVDKLSTDGAYNSPANLQILQQFGISWYLSALQGSESYFDFYYNEFAELCVIDLRTNSQQVLYKTPAGKYRITETKENAKNTYRYIEPKIVENYFRRKHIEQLSPEIRNRRSPIESTIHQVFYHLKGSAKSKYRGLSTNHLFVVARCLWVNSVRITKYFRQNPDKWKQSSFSQLLVATYRTVNELCLLQRLVNYYSSFFKTFCASPLYPIIYT